MPPPPCPQVAPDELLTLKGLAPTTYMDMEPAGGPSAMEEGEEEGRGGGGGGGEGGAGGGLGGAQAVPPPRTTARIMLPTELPTPATFAAAHDSTGMGLAGWGGTPGNL
jgi:hypothetical protein